MVFSALSLLTSLCPLLNTGFAQQSIYKTGNLPPLPSTKNHSRISNNTSPSTSLPLKHFQLHIEQASYSRRRCNTISPITPLQILQCPVHTTDRCTAITLTPKQRQKTPTFPFLQPRLTPIQHIRKSACAVLTYLRSNLISSTPAAQWPPPLWNPQLTSGAIQTPAHRNYDGHVLSNSIPQNMTLGPQIDMRQFPNGFTSHTNPW